MLHTGYVKLTDGAHSGEYAVQTPADNRWGFTLHRAEGDDSQSWPGGFGLAGEWVAVSADEVPADVRAEMDWLLQ